MSDEQKNIREKELAAASEITEGTDKVIAAKMMGDISRDLESAGVSNLTRAADAEIAAERLAALSDIVGAAGDLDIQGDGEEEGY